MACGRFDVAKMGKLWHWEIVATAISKYGPGGDACLALPVDAGEQVARSDTADGGVARDGQRYI